MDDSFLVSRRPRLLEAIQLRPLFRRSTRLLRVMRFVISGRWCMYSTSILLSSLSQVGTLDVDLVQQKIKTVGHRDDGLGGC